MSDDIEKTGELPGAPKASGNTLTKTLGQHDVVFACVLGGVLATLLIPLPTFVLDMCLSISIAVALATLVNVLSTRDSTEFSTFPSLLLFITLFRLSLNVASTRLILLQGDAGQIIETFGHFVVGGNLIVGLVVFLILVVIQFVVITKGSERISEVAARFNLDAMPGKQMAIDADLNAGIIGEEGARVRREKIVKESEFYGSMDGASKFIRGDAIAGLVITGVNLLGGFLVGMMKGMDASESMQTYAILAIGDGLVSQIPALIVSISSGFLVSKTSSDKNMGDDLSSQLFSKARPMGIASFLLAMMIFVPGFPKAPFAVLALCFGLLARYLTRKESAITQATEAGKQKQKTPEEQPVEELLDVDRVCIQVGPRLIKVVDPRRKNSLSHRIGPLRRKFAQQYGVILPLVRLRDNITLDATLYEIRINNHVISSGELEPDMLLAVDPGTVQNPVDGIATQEPVFSMPALWIREDQKEEAELRGYTVVDPESVLVTHLSEVLRRYAWELLSRDDVKALVDRLQQKQPSLVQSVMSDPSRIATLHRVMQNLLKEGIPIRDLPQILEAIGDNIARTGDPDLLSELSRKALVRPITELHADMQGRIQAITLEPSLEYELCSSVSESDSNSMVLAPDRAMEMSREIGLCWQSAMDQGYDKVVLLCDFRIRLSLGTMLSRQLPQLPVVAYDEISAGTEIENVSCVAISQAAGRDVVAAR